MSKPATIVASSVVVAAFLSGLATPAAAQMMGGYNFPARNPGLAAQYQYLRQQSNNGGTVQSGGIGALNQYVNTYTTNSQSVGNMHTVTVGDNSDANALMTAASRVSGMIRLFHAPQARSFRTLWLLEELGLEFDVRYMDFFETGSSNL